MDEKTIIIFDTTLRDGEQSPGASLTKEEKIIIAKQLAKLNVDVIEAGFPIASIGDFEAVKEIASVVDGPIICALARTKKEDIDRAYEAVKHSKKPRIHTFLATSKIHMDKKLKMSEEQVLSMVKEMITYANSLCKDIEFSPEDAARTDIDFMIKVVETAINAGAKTINIPDTVGYAEPEEFKARINYVFEKLGKLIKEKNVVISVHCHNDLGNAVANSLAAIKAGATQIECTINGIGERAGNCALEEVVMNIKTRKDYFNAKTNIHTKEIFKTSHLVSHFTGIDVQRNKAIVGKNAFAHEAGIHQHGVINDKLTYEIMNLEDIGWIGENLVIGKHSGKHAVESVLNEERQDLTKEQIHEITKKVKELADLQKEITKDDILAIADDVATEIKKEEIIISLDEINIETGNKRKAKSSVKLLYYGNIKESFAEGVGPVDATSKAIMQIIDAPLTLKEYSLKAINGGTDALADVTITIEDKEKNQFKARAVDKDIVMASAYAIIQGINRALKYQKSENKNNKLMGN